MVPAGLSVLCTLIMRLNTCSDLLYVFSVEWERTFSRPPPPDESQLVQFQIWALTCCFQWRFVGAIACYPHWCVRLRHQCDGLGSNYLTVSVVCCYGRKRVLLCIARREYDNFWPACLAPLWWRAMSASVSADVFQKEPMRCIYP